MAIQKITDSTPVTPGQWVCAESPFIDGLCDRPRMVVRSAGQRIYLTDEKGNDYDHYIARKSAAFICDTSDEAQQLYALNREQQYTIRSAEKIIKAEIAAKVAALSSGSITVDFDGAELDTLIAMVERGPLDDGDVPSKTGRDRLIKRGYAMRVEAIDFWRVSATPAGIAAYKAMFGPADTLREAQANRKAGHV